MSTWLNTIGTGIYGRDVRAAIHDSIEEVTSGQSTYKAIMRTIQNGFPNITVDCIYEVVSENSTLLSSPPRFAISKDRFNPETDGLAIWRTRESTEWRPMIINGDDYFCVEDTANGKINVMFVHNTTFQLNDEAEFYIFKPAYVRSADVKIIEKVTDKAYDDLLDPDPNTLYCVVSSSSGGSGGMESL